jgi:hypothetical protein
MFFMDSLNGETVRWLLIRSNYLSEIRLRPNIHPIEFKPKKIEFLTWFASLI